MLSAPAEGDETRPDADSAVLSSMSMSMRENLRLTNGVSVGIGPVESRDLPLLITHVREGSAETAFFSFGAEASDETIAAQCRRLLQVEQSGGVLVQAASDGAIVGLVSLQRGGGARVRHVAELAISVRKPYWGMGLGRALCARCFALGEQRGIQRVELRVRHDNTRAISLYASLGFVVEGQLRAAFRVADTDFDELIMARRSDGTVA
jgi:RimJ/RimL family protein N-acetyltransferase